MTKIKKEITEFLTNTEKITKIIFCNENTIDYFWIPENSIQIQQQFRGPRYPMQASPGLRRDKGTNGTN